MEKSTKELIPVDGVPIPDLMEKLAKALVGKGPALGFGEIRSEMVPKRIAVAVASSGTMGAHKEVALTASALLSSATASNNYLGANFGQVWSLLLPLTHVAGVNVLTRSLQLGTMPIDLRDATQYPRADFTAVVPTQLFRALNGDEKLLQHLHECKAVLVGGAALSDDLAQQARHVGIRVVTTYGMSETSGGCIYDGTPLDGVEIKIINGIVEIKGNVLATTYLNDESTWENSLEDGWFVTQDIGEIISGKLIVKGRADDVINSGGEKISLATVEEALDSNFPRSSFAAFTLNDAEWGDALHLAVETKEEISNEEIIDFLSKRFGNATKPKGIIRIEKLPLTDLGKLNRQALKLLFLESQVK